LSTSCSTQQLYQGKKHSCSTMPTSSSSTLLFTHASSFVLLCAARRHISPRRQPILHCLRHVCRRIPSTPPSPSISPVDARPSFFAFVNDDHWCDHTLRHSISPPPFLRQRISFYSSLSRSLFYHLSESAALLNSSLMGRVPCVLRTLGRQGPPRGVSSRGTYYWGANLSNQ